MIYLTPLIFNQINFSATKIGSGLAAAALIGTLARLVSGSLLDRGVSYSWPLRGAALLAIIADLLLFNAQSFDTYFKGQLLIGIAMGLYWPAIELAVPASCGEFPSSKGYALVRSSDALGVSLGTLIGTVAALLNIIRVVYLVDILCMISLLLLLKYNPINNSNLGKSEEVVNVNSTNKKDFTKDNVSWIKGLLPIISISLLATGVLSLLQCALPLDLVRGGIERPPLNEGWCSALVAVQLLLLVGFQWPIGNWLATHDPKFGLRISLSAFGIGCLLLGLSSLTSKGIVLAFIAQLPLAIALAAFLPTATESIIQESSLDKRGLALAMFSQCFAISAFVAPLIAGQMIDKQGNGVMLWTIFSAMCFVAMLWLSSVQRKKIQMNSRHI